jgi:hypothetical protein
MDVQLGMLSEKVIEEIECMSPFGTDNPKPVLASRRL